jgi:hypothetical protein
MQRDHLISADHFCIQNNIEASFLSMLHENGLIEITNIEETSFIPEDCLPEIERMIRLHYELDINLEGIEAITHLLRRVEDLQQELTALKNRLRMYESIETTSF